MIRRRAYRSFLSYIDLSREYYAAHGYTRPYEWISHVTVPFSRLDKPLSQCRVALLTTADLEKPAGDSVQERHLSREAFAHPVDEAPEQFYTLDLRWDQETTHTDDNESFLPLNHLAECAAAGRIGSVSHRFYGVVTDYSQGRTSRKSAPKILEFCREDGVDALLLPAL